MMTNKISDTIMFSKEEQKVSPKDPVKKKKGFFLMYKAKIESTKFGDDLYTQEIYLENRIKEYAKNCSNIDDENILKLLENCEGIQKLVHSIGISIIAEGEQSQTVNFVMQSFGKTERRNSGTTVRIPCIANGMEQILKIEDCKWSNEDSVIGRFSFEFEKEGELAEVYVKFYVNDEFDIDDVVIEEEIDTSSKEYKTMIKNSLMSKGVNFRLKKAIEKAKNKEKVTIAYIGGSITQGAGAKPCNTMNYAYRSYEQFKLLFDTKNVDFIKAGVGGTSSELGVIRYNRDILREGKEKPDIVIIEFAVNDADDETKGICYESLVKKCLDTDNKPAVILLFSVFADDWNLQDRLRKVGDRYQLPMVSIKNAVDWKYISKRQFFYDIFHPTNEGHQIMADCLTYLFEQVEKDEEDEEFIENIETVYGDYFKNVKLIDNKNGINFDTDLQMVEMDDDIERTAEFPYNWQIREEKEWIFRTKGLIVVFKDSDKQDFGKADIFVDGEYIRTMDPHINDWTHCNCAIAYMNDSIEEHVVKIKLCEKNKKFTVLGFGIVE